MKISGGSTSYITDNSTNWNTAYTHSQTTTGNPHQISVDDLTDATISSPISGQLLTYYNGKWRNIQPPITLSQSDVSLYSGQSITLSKFKVPSGKNVYIYQAYASDISGNSIISTTISTSNELTDSIKFSVLQFLPEPMYLES